MSIKYLVGNNKYTNKPSVPFGENELKFLDDFSKVLKNNKFTNKDADIMSFAFWCRKKNLIQLRKKFNYNNHKLGIGLVFHITPSNVPTNFLFSLIIGLLTGNSNIVKVPQNKFDQIDLICRCLNKTIKRNKMMKNRITVVKYDDKEYTKKFSSICDGRMIWGGDNTIQNVKNCLTKPKNRDITFPDKYSMVIFGTQEILKLKNNELKNLAKKFYNDTYKFDQNACTSPHLIVWHGKNKKILEAKNKFWTALNDEVKNKYNFSNFMASEKLNQLYRLVINNKTLKKIDINNNLIYRFSLDQIPLNNHELRGKWGIFFESEAKSLSNFKNFINEKYQTLTYFGIDKKKLQNFIIKNKLSGVDRIVPVGSSMNLSLIWDGYDLKNILTREIEIL